MHSRKKQIDFLYLVTFFILVSISIGLFIAFKPYKFVDNDKAKVICSKNGSSFDIGPNYIYTLTDHLDDFNDKKARKLCEYNIIRDYGDAYKTPETKNYQFKPVFSTDSGWGDAFLMTSIPLLLSFILISRRKQNISYIIAVIALSSLFFIFFLKKSAVSIYCRRQLAAKVVNFRNSAFKSGVIPIPEENKHIDPTVKSLYEKCTSGN